MNQWDTGRGAERLAAAYLRAKGYYIWKSNWRSGKKELDLVAIHKGELVIVEVKSRVGNQVNLPSEVVHPKKQRNIILAAEAFIRYHNSKRPTRFDVIAVVYSSRGVEIEHIENAFFPEVE
ncbi:MAG: YraN family protein [Bacteroidota bacterium]